MPEILRNRIDSELAELKQKSRFRTLYRSSGVNFGSNDYLGLAKNEQLHRAALDSLRSLPLSSSSSRLLPGYHEPFEHLEQAFAEFVGSEAALFFTSGYSANLGLLTTLTTRHDLVLYDERCHASWFDSVHNCRASAYRFDHNSAVNLEAKLTRLASQAEAIFVIIESVYSMDGDLAPIDEIAAVARRFDAILIIDEAHATGVVGPHGKGLSQNARSMNREVISVHTCGKALGAAGAFVACDDSIKEYLINRCRSFIFTTALPPIVAAQLEQTLKLLADSGDEMIARLHASSLQVRSSLQRRLRRWSVAEGRTPIIPVIVGGDVETVAASALLRERGFDVPAIRPPTVPEGTARLRLNVSLAHREADLAGVVDAIVEAEEAIVAE